MAFAWRFLSSWQGRRKQPKAFCPVRRELDNYDKRRIPLEPDYEIFRCQGFCLD
jgi:hypothetical protein